LKDAGKKTFTLIEHPLSVLRVEGDNYVVTRSDGKPLQPERRWCSRPQRGKNRRTLSLCPYRVQRKALRSIRYIWSQLQVIALHCSLAEESVASRVVFGPPSRLCAAHVSHPSAWNR